MLQHSEELDITPVDFTEVETWCFKTYRVSGSGLNMELESELRSIVEPFTEALGTARRFSANHSADLAKAQRELDQELQVFNLNKIHTYNRGTLARAVAKARLYFSGINSCTATVWIDYTGITQADADCLPHHLQKTLYEQFLQGFKDLETLKYTNPEIFNQELQQCLKKTLQQFKGRKLTRATADQIHCAILNSGLIDKASDVKIDEDRYQGKYYFTIEIDHGPLHEKLISMSR